MEQCFELCNQMKYGSMNKFADGDYTFIVNFIS